MTNLAKSFREEIQRISKRNTNQSVRSLRRDTRLLKQVIQDLARRIKHLEKEPKTAANATSPATGSAAVSDDDVATMRPTTEMVKRLRAKFKLAQSEFGKLMGVSDQAVYLWEHKKGRIKMRDAVKRRFAEVRQMRVRDVRKMFKV
jgi:DNA-binding transcriptional regulator YiaG